jgi:hypothetical protein
VPLITTCALSKRELFVFFPLALLPNGNLPSFGAQSRKDIF